MMYKLGFVTGQMKRMFFIGVALLGFLCCAESSAFASGSVTLSWQAVSDPNLAGYKVYYGVASRTYTNVVNVGNATSATISNLVDGVTYYFAVTAYNILGMESAYSAETTYTVPVPVVIQPPTLNPLSNITVAENASLQTVNLSGISTGATNQTKTITVTASSSNPSLIATPTVNYTSPGATGTLTFTPAANVFGSSVITVTVNNGELSNNVISRTFTVTVDAPPTVSSIANQMIRTNSTTGAISFTVSDPDTAAGSLTLSAGSSAPSLIPTSAIVFGGSGSNRTVTLTPVSGQSGTATITVTVSDGFSSSSTTFQLSVLAPPAPPASLQVIGGSP